MAITQSQLAKKIQDAFDRHSDVQVNPTQARKEIAEDLAAAFASYVVGRQTTVTGSSATGGAVTGVGTIKGDV